MRLWNGIVMYAPRSPDYYALPDTEHCIFRLMHKYGDAQAWNLYWLSQPQTDLIPLHRNDWHSHYQSFSGAQTRAFYEALDTAVVNRMTLASIMSGPPREAIRLLREARLERTRFYAMMGGEEWRSLMLGRLFLAERLNVTRPPKEETGDVVVADFILHRYARLGSHDYKHIKRPA
ncbi:hypothetical protein Q9Q94_02600 [Uliginosibacterium sp. 31-16]|uniref:hypothetical protein n=1 Tax=Uliginosibacterium sp. 31-16 TaxID=3068315 RepID=UPI00274016EF|nr:hypothetical protein [Uliginosibacterium sp. 31-16]MDP5238398.1 hypothetical protein [Uliginosibacterium sp. 31-16]